MGVFRALDADVPEEREQWLGIWRTSPEREPNAHPCYVKLFAGPGERVVAAVSEPDSTRVGCILFPLLLRPLAREPWASASPELWDASTPYGYGGAFAWLTSGDQVKEFWSSFLSWARELGVVSVVTRQSLFPDRLAPIPGRIVPNAPNVVCLLDRDEEEIWRQYAHKVRKNVKRALAAGLEVVSDEGHRLDDFLSVYHDTLQRRAALPKYYFNRQFFDRLLVELRGQFVFFHVVHKGQVLSTELVLLSKSTMYSFLGGTRAQAYPLRANDLLKHHAIQWGRRDGRRWYVLGGGYGGPDGIFQYKRGFAPAGVVTFNIGQIVVDERHYAELTENRRTWERSQGREWTGIDSFFPIYRS